MEDCSFLFVMSLNDACGGFPPAFLYVTFLLYFCTQRNYMNLPVDFLKDIETELGKTEAAALAAVLAGGDTVTSVRCNSRKVKMSGCENKEMSPVPWCKEGYYLKQRPAFTFDPLFHAGMYYVQEASSMFLQQVLKQYVKEPVRMLDLCAAPGGKSTLALQDLPQGSLLVSNEIDRQRSRILAENIIKWGNPAVVVTNNAPKDFSGSFTHFFDVLLTDVPCSGEGMFRKDPQAVEEWSEKNVSMCTGRQRDILRDCWHCLKPGGLFIYSTCTFNRHEDEENVHWIVEHLGAEPLSVEVHREWGITGNLAGLPEEVYHFFPHKTAGEGFFLAVLRKEEKPIEPNHSSQRRERIHTREMPFTKKRKQQKNKLVAGKVPDEVKAWLNAPESFAFQVQEDCITAVPKALQEDVKQLASLHLLQAGVTVAVRKGKDWAPAHSLAMSSNLNQNAFPAFEVTIEQAWTYLRGESFALAEGTPKGFVLITYRHHPLGFVKNIGNRSNNLYPQNWKIRSGHLPDPQEVLSLFPQVVLQ